MEGWDLLGQVLLLITAAVAAGVLCESLGLSAIIGYLLAGVIVGPSALNLVGGEGSSIALIAELGVALLLFGIGLEITPGKLRQFGWRGASLGILQVTCTGIVVYAIAMFWGLDYKTSIITGAIIAMSSTAVVMRLLVDRSALDSPHGRNTVAILLAQDVIVVPLLIMASILSGDDSQSTPEQLGKAAIGLIVITSALCVVGMIILPKLLGTRALRRNRDFGIVLAISTCLVSAWGSHAAGLSPALGAFIAGLILAGSPFARQIRADTSSLRAVFLTLFFASMGMLTDLNWLMDLGNLILVMTVFIGGLCIKSVIAAIAVRIMGANRRVSMQTGICIAQFGEFSFVLGSFAFNAGMLDETMFQAVVTASLLSLLATPFLVANARALSLRIEQALQAIKLWSPHIQNEDSAEDQRTGHVVVIGFGPAGEEACHLLRIADIGVFVIEMNSWSMKRALAQEIPAMIGDATQREILEHADIGTAAAVVVALPDTDAAIATVTQIRSMNKDALVVVRARYERRIADIRSAGADHVLNEETAVGSLLGATVVNRITGTDPEIIDDTESATP